MRRLLNTREDLSLHFRADMVNFYGVKLLTSGYGYLPGPEDLGKLSKGLPVSGEEEERKWRKYPQNCGGEQ